MTEKLKFDYSMKNIPVTTERSYRLKLIEQIQMVIKRMRWKVIYCDMKENSIKKKHGLKSHKTRPPINELAAFENDLIEIVKNIKFQTVHNQLQGTLKSDIQSIQQSSKTSNMYRLTKEEDNKIHKNATTSAY